ncbi:hypothetical protein EVAR_8132_1 [Eumeta japonica]|uniref:Uncharacterized protein n=1 Tax=Eumeta variegata TaxID=151549 RepID=A0A4C1TSS9_EUMVA|nr:hypothetical protein EVAR_8132_1 [Eumeta japonica]
MPATRRPLGVPPMVSRSKVHRTWQKIAHERRKSAYGGKKEQLIFPNALSIENSKFGVKIGFSVQSYPYVLTDFRRGGTRFDFSGAITTLLAYRFLLEPKVTEVAHRNRSRSGSGRSTSLIEAKVGLENIVQRQPRAWRLENEVSQAAAGGLASREPSLAVPRVQPK